MIKTNIDICTNYYAENFDNLVRSVSRTFPNDADAENAIQEAFARALTFLDSYHQERGDFEGWFRRILQNTIRDVKTDLRNQGLCMVDHETEVHDTHEKSSSSTDVNIAFGDTNADVKHMLELYYIKGYKLKDVAEAVGRKLSSVKNSIYRFKDKIVGRKDELI